MPLIYLFDLETIGNAIKLSVRFLFEKRKEAVKEIFLRLQNEKTEKMCMPKRQIRFICQRTEEITGIQNG